MQVTHDASKYSLQAPLQGFGYSCLAGVPGPRAESYMGLLFETATPDSQRDNISISVSKIAFALVPRLDTNRQWWAVEQPRNRGVGLKSDDPTCAVDEQCELNGRCVAGRCACEAAWSGEHCSVLNLLPATKGHGYRNTSAAGLRVSSWGGGVIWDEGTKLWNMFAAEFEEGCGL